MRYKAILFDLDGTILNTSTDICNSLNFALSKNGLRTFSVKETEKLLGNSLPALIKQALPNDASQQLIEACIKDFWEHSESSGDPNTAPYEGIVPLLEKLKAQGYRLGVVSNKRHDAAVKLVNRFFEGIFECVTGVSEITPRKPDPKMVIESLKKLGIESSLALMVGDTEVDAQTAQNAGTDFAAVTWGFRPASVFNAFNPLTVANTPLELEKLFE